MKLVSVTKFTRVEKALRAIRPFGNSVRIFYDLIKINNVSTAPMGPDLVVSMSGDCRLCGAVYSGIAKAVSGTLENKNQDINDNVKLICVGEKTVRFCLEFLSQMKYFGLLQKFSMAAIIFWMLNEGIVSELSALMIAMDGATKNATDHLEFHLGI
ncbi:hypothetical protein PV325_002952 [Microctonus aethiopoides]|uniref:Uncharacterized protein n=1 Tax=Microctonus aethiopoides TaxID=144406 RepID=A0AA39FMD5_9HYME|nr:hypothetical protein PV325_002952 [Microctonus aethiopoides]KAK0172086.1 hypothetical protein PV328_005453 [Microctonus aethiopoides]